MQANVVPFYTPLTLVWGQKVNKNSEEGQYANKMFDIMHTLVFGVG